MSILHGWISLSQWTFAIRNNLTLIQGEAIGSPNRLGHILFLKVTVLRRGPRNLRMSSRQQPHVPAPAYSSRGVSIPSLPTGSAVHSHVPVKSHQLGPISNYNSVRLHRVRLSGSHSNHIHFNKLTNSLWARNRSFLLFFFLLLFSLEFI